MAIEGLLPWEAYPPLISNMKKFVERCDDVDARNVSQTMDIHVNVFSKHIYDHIFTYLMISIKQSIEAS